MYSETYIRFENAVSSYLSEWDDWILSDYCFLNKTEIDIVREFRAHKNQRLLARRMRCNEATVRKQLHMIYLKLISGKHIYTRWQENRYEDPEYPLNVPVICLDITSGLKSLLNRQGETLCEILSECPLEQLTTNRGWGKKRIEELKSFLDRYGWLDRLPQVCKEYTRAPGRVRS